MNIMYSKRYQIFEEYKSIKDSFEKENYLMNKTIYFQTMDYLSDITYFSNNWDIPKSRIYGSNTVIPSSLAWILINIYIKFDIIILPMSN